MYKHLAFLSKKPSLTTDQFIDYYENTHIPLIISLSGNTLPPVYKRRYLREEPKAVEEMGFDVIVEQHFEDKGKFDMWIQTLSKDGGWDRVVADEERFLVRERTKVFKFEEFSTGP